MRIEGDGNRARSRAARLVHYGRKILPVPQMHAVKVADRGHRGPEARRNLSQRTEDRNRRGEVAHRITGTLNPS